MNFLDIFKKNTTVDSTGILSEPGDKLEARVTNSNRKVVKIKEDNLGEVHVADEVVAIIAER